MSLSSLFTAVKKKKKKCLPPSSILTKKGPENQVINFAWPNIASNAELGRFPFSPLRVIFLLVEIIQYMMLFVYNVKLLGARRWLDELGRWI